MYNKPKKRKLKKAKSKTVSDAEIDRAIEECVHLFGVKTANDYINNHHNI
jgi:hypothetical protein